jgi:hypothetical protein
MTALIQVLVTKYILNEEESVVLVMLTPVLYIKLMTE